MKTLISTAVGAFALLGSAAASAGEPTCTQFEGLDNHGEHVVGDYVSGIGGYDFGNNLGWPPDGSLVGDTVSGNGGAYIPGGPGPGSHFIWGGAPGASVCVDSESPGLHFPEGF